MQEFKRYIYALQVDNSKRVESVVLNLQGEDFEGDVSVTDVQLQGGAQATAPTPNTREILERVYYSLDENDFLNTTLNPIKEGVQPRTYENVSNRFYNFVGRGSDVIALPNVTPEDYLEGLVTSALSITLYAKDDFDLVRISTDEGALVEGRVYDKYDYPPLIDHPLNYKYTREFLFGGGKAGEKIVLDASNMVASVGNKTQPLNQGNVTLADTEFRGVRQRYMLAPYGAFRVRIEFYKSVTETLYWTDEFGEHEKEITYLKDVGIGFYGYAEFEQYKGRAKY